MFKAENLLVFEGVCSQLLEDIQERLVYRTHIYIKTEIRDYNPSSGDIAYPEKLETMEKIAAQLQSPSTPSTPTATNGHVHENNNSVSVVDETAKTDDNSVSIDTPSTPTSSSTQQIFEYNNLFTKSNHVSPADVHGMWFPTVRRTLICLSKLYRCLDVSLFFFKTLSQIEYLKLIFNIYRNRFLKDYHKRHFQCAWNR